MKKQFLATICISLLCLTTASPSWAQTEDVKTAAKKWLAINALAQKPDGLHLAAVASGGSYLDDGTESPKGLEPSLEHAISKSPLILIGTVTAKKPVLTFDGRSIQTLYTLKIVSVLRGNAQSSVIYAVPGGTIRYPDGTKAEVRIKDFTSLVNGHCYLILAQPDEDNPGIYGPSVWDESTFELDDDGHSMSLASRTGSRVGREGFIGVKALVDKVRSIIQSQ